jgi:hypothetical protein
LNKYFGTHSPNFFLPWKKTSECVFRIFSKFELENFGEYVPKFLYKDKNRKMGGRKETRGVGREKFLKNCGAQKDTETIGSVILSWQLLSLPHILLSSYCPLVVYFIFF